MEGKTDLTGYCDHCGYKTDKLKICEFHIGGFKETVVTKYGIEERPEKQAYCPNCAILHQHIGEGTWI